MNADQARNEAIFAGIQSTATLPELGWQSTTSYAESTPEEILNPLIDAHDVIAICGSYFGDEGKGKTVDDVAKHPKIALIARTNSGENAGHTVYYNGKKFVFHLAPSGLFKGKVNLIGPECVMDPVSFMDTEIQPLVTAGVQYQDLLFVGNVHIVTPYHKLMDFLQSATNASTLKGMAPVHGSKVTKRGIRMDHLFNSKAVCQKRLEKDMESYFAVLKQKNLTEEKVGQMCQEMNADGNIRIPVHVTGFVAATDKVKFMLDLYDKYVVHNPLFPKRADVTYQIRKALEGGQKVLLEGPQSYWLSNASEKFWESSTSADTGAHGLAATARYNLQKYKALVINIHKTPASSRIGIGANPSSYIAQDYFSRQDIVTLQMFGDSCRDFEIIQREFFATVQPNGVVKPGVYEEKGVSYGTGVAMAVASSLKHGECGATTLKPRVTGMFDCVMQFEVNQVQGPYLSISAVDRGDDYDKIPVVIAYVYYHPEGLVSSSNGREYHNGEVIRAGEPVPNEHVLAHCHPIVRLVQGWRGTPIAAKARVKGSPLPTGVQELISVIEHFTGSVVLSIGNGPHDGDFIYLKKAQ